MTLDEIRNSLKESFRPYAAPLQEISAEQKLVVNCDLMGRIRFIVPENIEEDQKLNDTLKEIVTTAAELLKPHGFNAESMVLYETDVESVIKNALKSRLLLDQTDPDYDALKNIWWVDRLLIEGNWAKIEPESTGAPRIVFFSIKGGVGRSTALAAFAYHFAQKGKKVMVLDLDLESPGLSSSLLPNERCPDFGITDWLVEDLVDNGDEVIPNMVGQSLLARDGEILVIPAHGQKTDYYVSKLGRVWMPSSNEDWTGRLRRLIAQLEQSHKPDIILIDSRAGIDETASACVTALGANVVLLFASDSEQSWTGYRLLFKFWSDQENIRDIRERLQMVAALVPEDVPNGYREEYLTSYIAKASELFIEFFYDEIKAGESEGWNFDLNDVEAPHYPRIIHWNRGFGHLKSIHDKLQMQNESELTQVFGDLFEIYSSIQLDMTDHGGV